MKLQLKEISKTFSSQSQAQQAIENISLDVSQGEFVCIVGPSGCGKTTILNILAGIEQTTTGQVLIEGKIGFIFQEAGLFPWLTVQQNIEFGLRVNKIPSQKRKEKIPPYIEMMHLQSFENAYPHELSGGMKQRAALARVLILDPDILLMDEPFAALDAQTREHLYTELHQIWQQTKKTIVFITHDIREAVFLGSRVLVMSKRPGRIQVEFDIPFSYPRDINSVEIATMTQRVRAELTTTAQKKEV